MRSEEYLGVPSSTQDQPGLREGASEIWGRGTEGEGEGGGAGEEERLGDGVLGWVGDVPLGDGVGAGRGSLRATVVVGVI